MASIGLLATVNMYTLQEGDLTNQLSDILTDIYNAASDTQELSTSTNDAKQACRDRAKADPYGYGQTQYQIDMDDIQGQYELDLSSINAWESQLEQKKETLETELKVTSSYKESFKSALKENNEKGYKYAQD